MNLHLCVLLQVMNDDLMAQLQLSLFIIPFISTLLISAHTNALVRLTSSFVHLFITTLELLLKLFECLEVFYFIWIKRGFCNAKFACDLSIDEFLGKMVTRVSFESERE
jgi:hypothetical protein